MYFVVSAWCRVRSFYQYQAFYFLPDVIDFLDFAIDSKIRCIEMSYCPHGDLHHQINCGGHYTNTDVAKWITQILSALMHVHEHCVLRRDIKPANILLGNGMTAMLADFGIAILEDQAPYAERCGTLGYEAPETVAGKQYGTLADIWSLVGWYVVCVFVFFIFFCLTFILVFIGFDWFVFVCSIFCFC